MNGLVLQVLYMYIYLYVEYFLVLKEGDSDHTDIYL